jgi:DNA-binding FadR family transcriptional regulator
MRVRAGAALEERIVELIHERGLTPGAAMPTEPQLMDLLGASRNSVREAIRALQALGIVDIRHGYGTFVDRRRSIRCPPRWPSGCDRARVTGSARSTIWSRYANYSRPG